MNGRSLFALATVALFAAATAQAVDFAKLKERFKERYPKLLKAKDAGKIGETFSGYVEAVKPEYLQDAALKKLLEEENADRKTLYRAIARKEGVAPEKVAERHAVRNFKKAKPGHWLKNKDGKWVKKQ